MVSVKDQAFLQILREEKNITNFLDVFFGFLYRCTDFYVESGAEEKLGFPPGVVEKLVLNSFQKWRNISKCPVKTDTLENSERDLESTELRQDNPQLKKTKGNLNVLRDAKQVQVERLVKRETTDTAGVIAVREVRSPDSYNGAVREGFTWSQTISDLDVLVKLPSHLKTSKDLKVSLDSNEIKVEARLPATSESLEADESFSSQWSTIFFGELCFLTRKDESVWSIMPGQYVSIHLEKALDRWWDALIVGEPKIELSRIDCSRNFDDMGLEEQMKVQELMWNHQQKLIGNSTSEQIKMEKILKEAWDAKGSPFEGTPYDPSILKFN